MTIQGAVYILLILSRTHYIVIQFQKWQKVIKVIVIFNFVKLITFYANLSRIREARTLSESFTQAQFVPIARVYSIFNNYQKLHL